MTLVFDGGSLGNPGDGYGSFHLSDRHGFSTIERLQYGTNVTNNQAEYRTLIEGLKAALAHAREHDLQPSTCSISVRTDSKLVVEQVNGRWKVRHAGLQPLCIQAKQLIAQFGRSELAWHPRAVSVKVLGH
jgi:probable phosphoglycerate mutase